MTYFQSQKKISTSRLRKAESELSSIAAGR